MRCPAVKCSGVFLFDTETIALDFLGHMGKHFLLKMATKRTKGKVYTDTREC